MNFFGNVKAQGLDTVASPTIPFDPPLGITPTVAISPTPQIIKPSISLSSENIQIQIGNLETIEMFIDTQDIEITGFTIVVRYDPTLVRIIDENASLPGKQILYENNFFLETENAIDEETGTITLAASTEQGSATISGTPSIASFQIEALAEGFTTLEIIQIDSALVNDNSVDILGNINNVDLTITTTDNPVVTATQPVVGITDTNGVFITATKFPDKTPDTALFDDYGTSEALIGGMLLIVIGFFILRYRKNAQPQDI